MSEILLYNPIVKSSAAFNSVKLISQLYGSNTLRNNGLTPETVIMF